MSAPSLKNRIQGLRRKRKDSSFLDFDSPYSEFLPARFREWCPDNMNNVMRFYLFELDYAIY
jgi:hypothetical protein